MEFQAEAVVFLMLFIRIISDEGSTESSEHHLSNEVDEVLVMEIMRGYASLSNQDQ